MTGKSPRYRFRFTVGLSYPRSCTVYGKDYEDALAKCRAEMDRRYAKSGDEPPVGYDIALIDTTCPGEKK